MRNFTEEDLKRIAQNIHDYRMLKNETWGTSEGDYEYAKKLLETWCND